ncbi:uncharacterized protein [Watersipora subatra]|uniref:uncharacterized protein n=1 Tax=Watersipora subatra TaxID=2589382 RepID=UPI00355AD05D
MDDRGRLEGFLGIDFSFGEKGHYHMSQERYTTKILRKFKMENCKPAATPAGKGIQLLSNNNTETDDTKNYPYREAIGGLLYLMTATRPDICWTVSKLSQYLNNPGKPQLEALKRWFRYIQVTKHYKLTFTQSRGNLTGYCD